MCPRGTHVPCRALYPRTRSKSRSEHTERCEALKILKQGNDVCNLASRVYINSQNRHIHLFLQLHDRIKGPTCIEAEVDKQAVNGPLTFRTMLMYAVSQYG